MSPTRQTPRRGFTLIELLVVVAIIAVLISILLPALSQAREQGKVAKCTSNLKQIAGVMHMYFTDYKDWFPFEKDNSYRGIHGFYYGGHPGRQYSATEWWGYVRRRWRDTPRGRPFNRYMYPDLPDYDVPVDDPLFEKVRNMPVYQCPSDINGFFNTDPNTELPSIYWSTGSSYDFNYHFILRWAIAWPFRGYEQRWLHRGNAFLKQQLLTNASTFVMFYEDPFDTAQWNLIPRFGWHRQWMRHNFGFLDGHAAYTLADTSRGDRGVGWKTSSNYWWTRAEDPDYKYREIAPLPGP